MFNSVPNIQWVYWRFIIVNPFFNSSQSVIYRHRIKPLKVPHPQAILSASSSSYPQLLSDIQNKSLVAPHHYLLL